jgi:hypothetical protein
MAEKKKSIIEEFLLEAKSLEDALKANTKEMLAAHMSKEIENIVESSLKEEDEEEEEIDDVTELGSDDNEEEDVELDLDVKEEEPVADSDEDQIDLDLDFDSLSDEEGDKDEDEDGISGFELNLDGLNDLGDEEFSDEDDLEVRDLRTAPDDKVIKAFKLMKDNDVVEVVKDDEGIHLTDNETGAEYYIKESMDEKGGEYCKECGSGAMYEEDENETIYEIELDDKSDLYGAFQDVEEGEYIDEEEEIVEDRIRRHRADGKQRYTGARLASGRNSFEESKRNRKPLTQRQTNKTVAESKMIKEYKELKEKNEEYKKALNIFKDKLNEVAIFNTNLAYVNRLFTEHSTTKKEKMDILKRFDGAETIKESKNIYKTIKEELDRKSPINESVEVKVNKTIKSANVTNLNESTAYVDPQIKAIKDLMKRIS